LTEAGGRLGGIGQYRDDEFSTEHHKLLVAAIGENSRCMTSPELTGGAGFTFEDAVAAFYLAALVSGTTAAGLTPRVVHRVALQQKSFGEPRAPHPIFPMTAT